ncbi:MAG: hypothetical protein IPF98_25265 [Gemmatimonadetes bacterium]|nr:hypothetical protein [Gemmatimonadota bacterium]
MRRGAFDFALVSLATRPVGRTARCAWCWEVALRPWRVTDSIGGDVASGGLSDDDIETLAARRSTMPSAAEEWLQGRHDAGAAASRDRHHRRTLGDA